jgi:site-specific recombinase XerD
MPRPDILSRRIAAFLMYLEDEREASPHTLSNYERDLRHCAAWLRDSGGLATGQGWDKVTHLQLRRYLSECNARYAPISITRRVSVLKAFFGWLEGQGVRQNPAAVLRAPKVEVRVPSFLSLAEIEKMLAVPDVLTAAGKRDRALLEVLYATGMRAGECAALTLDDVQWRAGEIRVRDPKNKGGRMALLGRPALEALRGYVQNGRPELVARRVGPPPSALWITRRGTPMTVIAIGIVVGNCAKHARLARHVTPAMLRHSCAAHLLENGADSEVVRQLLGHTNTQRLQRLQKAKRPASET